VVAQEDDRGIVAHEISFSFLCAELHCESADVAPCIGNSALARYCREGAKHLRPFAHLREDLGLVVLGNIVRYRKDSECSCAFCVNSPFQDHFLVKSAPTSSSRWSYTRKRKGKTKWVPRDRSRKGPPPGRYKAIVVTDFSGCLLCLRIGHVSRALRGVLALNWPDFDPEIFCSSSRTRDCRQANLSIGKNGPGQKGSNYSASSDRSIHLD
jgi:hypothetical protein